MSDKIFADSAQFVPRLCLLQPVYACKRSKNKNYSIKFIIIGAHHQIFNDTHQKAISPPKQVTGYPALSVGSKLEHERYMLLMRQMKLP